MILHVLCLFMVVMLVNSVISAPGNDAFRKIELVARNEKQKTLSSGTLDPLGGGNLVRIVDPEAQVLGSLDSLPESKNDAFQKIELVTRSEKQKPSSSGTLDPIGGGNLLRIVDPEAETQVLGSLDSLQENQSDAVQKISLIAREEKQKPSSSGTLDPLGGGNLVRIVEPEERKEVLRSLYSLLENQNDALQKIALVSRVEKKKHSSSGTLDSLGGGNLLRISDPEAETGILGTLDSRLENQGSRQNMIRLAREDKSTQRSSHALDGLGGVTGAADPYKEQILRSLGRSHLVDSPDQGSDVLKMLDSISGTELLSSLDSAEGMAVLNALRKTHTKYPKRMLDSVSGWAFGTSKRNFDEIDNVGFTGFAKRSPYYKQLALAKKNFDEIDRAGFETYNKRDFDEIDRAGFETFEKRDRKE